VSQAKLENGDHLRLNPNFAIFCRLLSRFRKGFTMAKAEKFISFAGSKPALSKEAIAIGREAAKTKEGALKLLQEAGIVDKNGKLAKPYR
jgi:hypothetical protein